MDFEIYAKRLESELRYASSVEWYLIKLSTLVLELRSICSDSSSCIRNALLSILDHDGVKRYMSILARYRDSVVKLIDSDPRFRNLREYRELLYEYLGALPKDYSKDLYELKPKEYSFRREDTVYTIPMEEPSDRATGYDRDVGRGGVAVEKNIPIYRRTTIGRGGRTRNIKRIIIIAIAIEI